MTQNRDPIFTRSPTLIGRGPVGYTGSTNRTRRTRGGSFHAVILSFLHEIKIQFSSVLCVSLVVGPQCTQDLISIPCKNATITEWNWPSRLLFCLIGRSRVVTTNQRPGTREKWIRIPCFIPSNCLLSYTILSTWEHALRHCQGTTHRHACVFVCVCVSVSMFACLCVCLLVCVCEYVFMYATLYVVHMFVLASTCI